jgi:hypothetical protein
LVAVAAVLDLALFPEAAVALAAVMVEPPMLVTTLLRRVEQVVVRAQLAWKVGRRLISTLALVVVIRMALAVVGVAFFPVLAALQEQ